MFNNQSNKVGVTNSNGSRRSFQRRTFASKEAGEMRRYGSRFTWEVTPDYWKPSWGQKPILGYVKADSAFEAKYAAYDRGLLIYNATFGPEVTQVTRT